ncbi:MAG TPA: acyl-CoA dehydrogenase family protein [Candidatus Dormibacteraeota bacterium]|nr:acyl-CoA dehydrogenase family protein [Candidatus Dormibacteraeota bacterium]
MDARLSAEQRAVEERFAELFNDELNPSIRRMCAREARAGTVSAEDAEARAALWDALVDLGALRLRLPALVVLAEQMGGALYQSPFFDTVTATELLAESGHPALLDAIGGAGAVAIAARDGGAADPSRPGPMHVDHARGTVTARRWFVAFAADAGHLLLAGRPCPGSDVRLALVPRDQPGVRLRRQDDIARGDLYAATLDGAASAGPVWGAGGAWQAAVTRARIRHAAYLVGLARGALALAAGRAREREQFGQPIGRFQAVGFRLAELTARAEGARLLTHLAAWEADAGRDPRLTALQALSMAADLAREVTATAVQVHGAVGITEESDAQLFYRRAVVDAVWLGTPGQLRDEALPLLRERTEAGGETHVS